jgi:Mg2+/citrate symporter
MEPLTFTADIFPNLMWTIFGLFVGIAIATDLGIIDRMMRSISSKNKNNKDKNREVLSLKERNKKTFDHALRWTIIWISLAVVLTGMGDIIAYIDGLHFCEEVYPYTNRKKV